MPQPLGPPATYVDLDALPEGTKAQLAGGVLVVPPRPSIAHQAVASALGEELKRAFHRGRAGPGGWIILVEPQIRVASDALAPDLAGWRRERLPKVPRATFVTRAPDCVCEVLSPSTAAFDRGTKLDVYASWNVAHAWLVDPEAFTLETFNLETGSWVRAGVWSGMATVRAAPFDAIALDLSLVWPR